MAAMARHGGGAFSGKDPTKVDRSAAYAARLCRQEHRSSRPGQTSARFSWPMPLAWPIRYPSYVNTFGTGNVPRTKFWQRLWKRSSTCVLTAIIHMLDLRRPIYRQLAAYGHYRTGRNWV